MDIYDAYADVKRTWRNDDETPHGSQEMLAAAYAYCKAVQNEHNRRVMAEPWRDMPDIQPVRVG